MLNPSVKEVKDQHGGRKVANTSEALWKKSTKRTVYCLKHEALDLTYSH